MGGVGMAMAMLSASPKIVVDENLTFACLFKNVLHTRLRCQELFATVAVEIERDLHHCRRWSLRIRSKRLCASLDSHGAGVDHLLL